jgi:adenine phosphoribosyltransferase
MVDVVKEILENSEIIHDYPKKGIVFRDLTPILADKRLFSNCIDHLSILSERFTFDVVAGVEARGFIFGSALAFETFAGFVPVRKKGKLPRKVVSEKYALEYGFDEIEVHVDDVKGKKVLIVDDVLASGGTAQATCKLIEKAGGIVVGCLFVVEIEALNGRDKLGSTVVSVVKV